MERDGLTAGDLGEFGLIERLTRMLGLPSDERLIAGIGDDAAVWRCGDAFVIATTDTMVAGGHFLPDQAAWRDIGWKALASNVSDIAAMGGAPSFALVTLCVPAETHLDALDELYAGIGECASAYNVTVAGGDVVASPVFTVTIALMGEAMCAADGSPLLLRRSAALPGDGVAVTGPLGGSGGGLRALLEGGGRRSDVHAALVRRHMRPRPRVDAGRAAVTAGVHCGMDISDGLVQDLGHICKASNAGADLAIDRVPIDPSLVAAYPDAARAIAATAGEDYELLLVARDDVLANVSTGLNAPLTIVGQIVEGDARVRVLDAAGKEVALDHAGFDHLKRG